MDVLNLRARCTRALITLLALTAGASTIKATNLLNVTASVTVTCNTATGPGAAQNIVVKPATALTGSNTIAVSFVSPSNGLVVTAPANQTLSTANQSAGITYTVAVNAGCANAVGTPTTLQFTANTNNDATTTVNDNLTATTSALVANNVTISCVLSGGVYTPGPAQTISVTSHATGGTPFTVDTTLANDPATIVLNPTSPGGTASSTAVTFTVAAAAGCGTYASGSTHTVTLHLLNAPAPLLPVTVTYQVVPPSPLTVTPVPAAPSITLSYTKGSSSTVVAGVSVTSTLPSAFFTVLTSTFPSWLTVNTTSGTAPASLQFSTTSVAATLAPGSYSATVYLGVSGYANLGVPITLLVNNAAPKLTVNATTIPLTWTIGTAAPTATITASSTDTPIQYTITTGGTLAPVVDSSELSGLVYSFGTQIGVSFSSTVLAAAQPGQVLTGTVTFTWGSPASTTVVTIQLTVQSPGATLTGISPASLPTAAAGTSFQVVMTGTGFVGGSDPTLKTRVGIVVNNTVITDSNLSANILNPTTIILTITVPTSADVNLPFSPSGNGGNVVLGLCNGTCTVATGTATLTIGKGPIIQGATSASSFIEVAAPTIPTFAPYDMVSLFGSNFCSSNGTGCSSSQVLSGAPDAVTHRYPTTLSPDNAGATQRSLTVTFLQHGTSTVIATAPLLFATNSQINMIVPAAVSSSSTADIVVSFGYGTGTTMLKSAPYEVNIATTDPGIFTVGADGQGNAAALDLTYALISSTNQAGMRSTQADSDIVQIYVTGLGAPTSTASNASTGGGAAPTDCIAATGSNSYLAALNAATNVNPALTSVDGAIIQSALINTGRLGPCFTTNPTVKIGGVAATVSYAGWVEDSVAGLYQINAKLPDNTGTFYPYYPLTSSPMTGLTVPAQLPVQVTMGGVTSQSNVMLWVAPRLKVTPPGTLSGTVGVAYSSSVAATEGTSPYHYAVTSGVLPPGVTINTSTGALTGTPAASSSGSYAVTVTATDSANTPVTGTVSFTITVAGGLFMSASGTAGTSTFGSANANASQVITPSGGTYPYTFTVTVSQPSSGSPAPTGMTFVPTGGTSSSNGSAGSVVTTAATPAGVYHVTVTATDSSSTPLTGSITFDITVNLDVAFTTPATVAASSSTTITTVSATGGSGTYHYTLDPANTGNAALVSVGLTSGIVTAGTAVDTSISGMPVIIDVTDTGSPNTGAASVGPGTTTVTVIIQN